MGDGTRDERSNIPRQNDIIFLLEADGSGAICSVAHTITAVID